RNTNKKNNHTLITMKHTLQLLFFLAISYTAKAQYTLIPDSGFEQALINLNIDSEGILDGQVLTSDIENVTELIFLDNYHITDLTGIEDFAALEVLNLNHNFDLTSLDVSNNLALRILDVSQNSLTELDLSNNILLEELYCGNPTDDVWPQNEIVHLDLSQNPNIQILWAEIMFSLLDVGINLANGNNERAMHINVLRSGMDWSDNMFSLLDGGINLANGNNETAMHINVLRSGMDWTDDTPICIQVDDAQTAINGESPYSDWTVIGGHFYSEKACALSISGFEKNEISIYPNPASDSVILENLEGNISINILDFTGTRIYTTQTVHKELQLDLTGFIKGIYLVQVISRDKSMVKKLVVN